jgi:hypothetical protein
MNYKIRKIISRYFPIKILNKIRRIGIKGNNVYCILCQKQFKKFLNYRGRNNAQCPNCSSLERERMLALFFLMRLAYSGRS